MSEVPEPHLPVITFGVLTTYLRALGKHDLVVLLTLTLGVGLPLVAFLIVAYTPFIGWKERGLILTVYFTYIATVLHVTGGSV